MHAHTKHVHALTGCRTTALPPPQLLNGMNDGIMRRLHDLEDAMAEQGKEGGAGELAGTPAKSAQGTPARASTVSVWVSLCTFVHVGASTGVGVGGYMRARVRLSVLCLLLFGMCFELMPCWGHLTLPAAIVLYCVAC